MPIFTDFTDCSHFWDGYSSRTQPQTQATEYLMFVSTATKSAHQNDLLGECFDALFSLVSEIHCKAFILSAWTSDVLTVHRVWNLKDAWQQPPPPPPPVMVLRLLLGSEDLNRCVTFNFPHHLLHFTARSIISIGNPELITQHELKGILFFFF